MAAMSWLLRMRPVPLMPRLDASACSSGRTIAESPVPVRRRRVVAGAPSASTGVLEASERSSLDSLTKGPSQGAGAGLCGHATRWCDPAGAPDRAPPTTMGPRSARSGHSQMVGVVAAARSVPNSATSDVWLVHRTTGGSGLWEPSALGGHDLTAGLAIRN